MPYCLRVTEEQKIYEKLVSRSELADVALRAGDAGDAGPVLGAVAAEAARELDALRQDAGL